MILYYLHNILAVDVSLQHPKIRKELTFHHLRGCNLYDNPAVDMSLRHQMYYNLISTISQNLLDSR